MTTSDLHGNAPDDSVVALLLIDVINDMEFEGGDRLLPQAVEAATRIRALKVRAAAAGIPAIYANDNFGRWRSDFREVVEHSLQDGVRGEALARLLQPSPDDYFVLKPKHSAFFATTLDVLLDYVGARTLILAGYSGDICVLATALDAYMRDFELFVPRDCVASATVEENRQALDYMERVFRANTTASTDLDLRLLLESPA